MQVHRVDPTVSTELDEARWRAYWALANAEARRAWGDDADQVDPAVEHRMLTADANRTFPVAVVEQDGRVVGGAAVRHVQSAPREGRVHVFVDLGSRRRGIGTVLAGWALDELRGLGGERARVGIDHGPAHEGEPGQAPARRLGFTEFQRAVLSRADLADVPVLPCPQGYAVDVVVGLPPTSWHADLTLLKNRMATDAPAGDAAPVEDHWDVARYVARHERSASTAMTLVTAVVRPVGSGRVVGFSEAVTHPTEPAVLHQCDTLVLREHRGHGLGLALKSLLLSEARSLVPSLRFSRTSNAAENVAMRAVNARLGYVPEGEWSRWQRAL